MDVYMCTTMVTIFDLSLVKWPPRSKMSSVKLTELSLSEPSQLFTSSLKSVTPSISLQNAMSVICKEWKAKYWTPKRGQGVRASSVPSSVSEMARSMLAFGLRLRWGFKG